MINTNFVIVIVGAPTSESTLPKKWKLTLGRLTASGSRNALIVSDSIFASIDREGDGQFKIKFVPETTKKIWMIKISKKNDNGWDPIHEVHVSGASELAYEQGITRVRMGPLFPINRYSPEVDLYDEMKNILTGIETPMSVTDTYQCEE